MPSKKEILARTLDITGCGGLLRRLRPWRGLLILNYHRIGEPGDSGFDAGVFSATANQFDRQLGWLKRHADVIPLGDLDRALASQKGRFVLLTFDDGYADNHQLALPLLEKHATPAAFFITTGFIDDRRIAWWDEISWMVTNAVRKRFPAGVSPEAGWTESSRPAAIRTLLRHFKALPTEQTPGFLDAIAEATGAGRWTADRGEDPWMSWEMVRELRAAGHAIGAHTVTHPLLGNSTPERQQQEIVASKSRLESQLGTSVEGFSYPVGIPGSYTDDTVRLVREAGIRWAFSFQGGYVRGGRPHDSYRLPRVAVDTTLSDARFRALQTLPQVFG